MSNSMNSFLAEYYGTNGASAETTKEASLENAEQIALFAKLAADNGLDLNKLSEAQVDELYARTFAEGVKTGGEMPPAFLAHLKGKDGDKDEKSEDKGEKSEKKDEKKDDEEKEKKAAAEREWTEKKAQQDKLAEADFLGRTMAHAYVDELGKIAAAAGSKTASVKEAALAATPAVTPAVTKEAAPTGPALEELAIKQAFAMVQEFNKTAGEQGWDEQVAADRLQAVYTLGLGESTKVASAANVDEGIQLRALEYLERAGYPVKWTT